MELVKENKEKGRAVYKLADRYRKVWYDIDTKALQEHLKILDTVMPGWVIDYGFEEDYMWIEYNL